MVRVLGSFLLITCMGISPNAFGGAGARGGGEVVDINGEYFPRDIVEQARCDWVPGSDMIKAVPETKKLFQGIAKVDWYFALELEREMSFLNFCLTGPLHPIFGHSRNVPQIFSSFTSEFVGLRHNTRVLLDGGIFYSPKMSGDSRALILAHETMHTYITMDMDPGERRIAMFTAVDTLARARAGTLTSDQFHYKMRQSNVDFPQTAAQLEPYKLQVSFVLGNTEQKARMLLETRPVDRLVRGHYSKLAPLLAEWDQDTIKMIPEAALTEAYQAVISVGTSDEIQMALNQTSSRYVSPQTIALAELSKLSTDQKPRVLGSIQLPQVIVGVLNHMAEADVQICKLNICANSAFQDWTGVEHSSLDLPVVSIAERFDDREFSIDWRALTNGLVELIRKSDWNNVEDLIKRPLFSAAIKLSHASQSLSSINPPMPREKQYVQEDMEHFQQATLEHAFNVFDAVLEPDESAHVSRLIREALEPKVEVQK